MRVRRRKRRLLVFISIVAIIGAIVYGISFVSYMPRFSVEGIAITGAQRLSAEYVRSYVEARIYDGRGGYLSPHNIFMYPRQQIEASMIADFPRVKDVRITRASLFAQQIDVAIAERVPFARWCSSGVDASSTDCYVMDENGFIFSNDQADLAVIATSTFAFSGGIKSGVGPVGQTFAPGHVSGLVTLFKNLTHDGVTPIGALVQNDQDFLVPLAEGFTIKASFGLDAVTLGNDLSLVLGSEALQGKMSKLDYIDLRFGNRVYYRLKGEQKPNEQKTVQQ